MVQQQFTQIINIVHPTIHRSIPSESGFLCHVITIFVLGSLGSDKKLSQMVAVSTGF
jgi:hypothetical protein